ncbi:MAG: hypothetical protein H6747_13330, partial [Deltaproteobacteria bacterium]|nr:hypothetical protein [Deltaproteobacteria bacterium]
DRARTRAGEQADALFAAAAEKFAAALAVKPDNHNALFNLACLHGLRGDVAGCIAALERRLKVRPTLTQANLDADHDFDAVRSDPRFTAFRERLAP